GSIVSGDAEAVARSLAASPALASSSLRLEGATRLSTQDYFFDEIGHYLFAGHTAPRRGGCASKDDRARAGVDGRGREGQKPSRRAAAALRRGRDTGFSPLGPKSTEGHRCRFAPGRRRSHRGR